MQGLMMAMPLMISSLIQHAARYHSDTEIVSRTVEGGISRYTWCDAERRARQLAQALLERGVQSGERIATLAWNGFRHLELYYAVSGIGSICHTVNPRLFADQINYILNHAEDTHVFFDLTFLPLLEKLAPSCPGVRAWIVMTDDAHMPVSSLPHLLCYEDLIARQSGDFTWPQFDEKTASALCYTSGTTGNPKGVLYSHRSTVLHAYALALQDTSDLSARAVVLPVVPMFHVSAWGIPYAAALVGAKLVLPGAAYDGASLYELLESERVTATAGVPTVWLNLLQYMRQNGLRFRTLQTVLIGGAAAPRALIEAFQEEFGVSVRHAWGMTETSPLGVANTFKSKHLARSKDERDELQVKQGRAICGVEMKIIDGEGRQLPNDGNAFGDLMVRGPWIAERYFGDAESALVDGWFPTGDVATIDADGYLNITDRSKDVIKSGGEWISSIALENTAVAHPAVAEAAVIGIRHTKWDERPLLIVVKKPDAELTREEILKFFEGKVAKWMIPDDAVFVDSLPHTATGKLLKTKLREEFRNYALPAA